MSEYARGMLSVQNGAIAAYGRRFAKKQRPGRAGPLLGESPPRREGSLRFWRAPRPSGEENSREGGRNTPVFTGKAGDQAAGIKDEKSFGRRLFVLICGQDGVDLGFALLIKVCAPLFRERAANDDFGLPFPGSEPRIFGFSVLGVAARIRPTVDEAVLVFFREFERVDGNSDLALADPVEKDAEKLAPAVAAKELVLLGQDPDRAGDVTRRLAARAFAGAVSLRRFPGAVRSGMPILRKTVSGGTDRRAGRVARLKRNPGKRGFAGRSRCFPVLLRCAEGISR